MEKQILDESCEVPNDLTTIPLSRVEFQRTWVVWENYTAKENNQQQFSYNDSIKEITEFSDLITFWQFWNSYPGAIPKNFVYDGERSVFFFEKKMRIDGLNIFSKGIIPKWEDSNNKGGRTLHLLYDVKQDLDEFLNLLERYWLDLALMLLGESFPFSQYVSQLFKFYR